MLMSDRWVNRCQCSDEHIDIVVFYQLPLLQYAFLFLLYCVLVGCCPKPCGGSSKTQSAPYRKDTVGWRNSHCRWSGWGDVCVVYVSIGHMHPLWMFEWCRMEEQHWCGHLGMVTRKLWACWWMTTMPMCFKEMRYVHALAHVLQSHTHTHTHAHTHMYTNKYSHTQTQTHTHT